MDTFAKDRRSLPPAVVMNAHYNGLSIIQELGRRGVLCYALDSQRSIGTYSRYATYHRVADPQVDEEAFLRGIIAFLRKLSRPPVIFPTNDQWAMALAKHAADLEGLAIPCVAAPEVVSRCVLKEEFYRWAAARGYPVPRTWRADQVLDIPESDFPIVVKPAYRRISRVQGEAARRDKEMLLRDDFRLAVLDSPREAKAFLDAHRKIVPRLVFQQLVRGRSDQMYTVGVYVDRNHDAVGVFTGRKVRGYPAQYGDCVVGEAVSVPRHLVDISAALLRDLEYRGIAEVEFKKDAVTGQYFLIEVNPRSWSWIGITPQAGVNLPWMAYRDLLGEPVRPAENQITDGSIRYVKLLQDGRNCLLRYALDAPDWRMSFPQWLADLRRTRLVVAEFNAADWPVALRAIAEETSNTVTEAARWGLRRLRGSVRSVNHQLFPPAV